MLLDKGNGGNNDAYVYSGIARQKDTFSMYAKL